MSESVLENIGPEEALLLFGRNDENLHVLRDLLNVQFVSRGSTLTIRGEDVPRAHAIKVLEKMRGRIRTRRPFSVADVKMWTEMEDPFSESGGPGANAPVELAGPIRRLKSRTDGQGVYINAIREHHLTVCIGPAGTGKTYLAVGAALEALQRQHVKRIVLVRPAVEAGEKLGYLPGDLQAKVHPFVRPLLDALREMLDFHQVKRYMDEDIVEIAPLAYMRGRTLNDSFIILDEGQNTTIPQMKMFLTRMGANSKIVVTGDVTQVDLPQGVTSGLHDAVRRLSEVPGVAVVRMAPADIVRHPLVEAIVRAYDESEGRDSYRRNPAHRAEDSTSAAQS